MVQLEISATNNGACNDDLKLPDTKFHKYLQPILGTACTIVYIQKLEELNPELSNNDGLKDTFISVIDKIPDEDKNYVITAALKVSKIKEVLLKNGNMCQYADSYKNFENIATRLLQNLYNLAKCANDVIFDKTIPSDKKIEMLESPLAIARLIIRNDTINKSITSIQSANKDIDMAIYSAAGGLNEFPVIVQYIAEKSAKAAEIIFTKKDFRDFPKWQKIKAIKDAQKRALTGEKEIDLPSKIKAGIQND